MVDNGCLTAASDRFNAAWTQLEPPDSDCGSQRRVEHRELVDAFADGLVTHSRR
jgi:hypothetical protein